MLSTDDVGLLFATLQAAYGYRWAHKADAIPVWLEKLRPYASEEVMRAANIAIDEHQEPPTLAKFLAILKSGRPRISTYALPAPFDRVNANKAWDHMERLAGKSLRPETEANQARLQENEK